MGIGTGEIGLGHQPSSGRSIGGRQPKTAENIGDECRDGRGGDARGRGGLVHGIHMLKCPFPLLRPTRVETIAIGL